MAEKKSKIKIALYIVLAVFIILQFIPVDRSNPATTAGEGFTAPAEVTEIVRTSCFDCHSNETVWPWYSYVAPVSWLVSSDVAEGREHFNLSHWPAYSNEEKGEIAAEMIEEIEEGEMPLGIYLIMHSEAEITKDELAILAGWAESLGAIENEGSSTENIENERRNDSSEHGHEEAEPDDD